ncbi:MAG: nicotinate-nucleotide adenylyltransferase [Opitutaceae bacterium]|nr:nicotinate-nucleotide adenylyltransferase [Opitutaceae bacterium]
MKLGLFGGTFDPVHIGHLIAARDALEGAGLDRVLFVPAAQAPMREAAPLSAPLHRLALLERAIASEPRFFTSDVEIRRGGTSFTIDTALELQATHPGDELHWIIGGDQLHKLHRWHRIEDLARCVTFVAVQRPGHSGQLEHSVPGLRLVEVRGHSIELSSTEVRQRCAAGLSLEFFLPHKAIAYLNENGLYR